MSLSSRACKTIYTMFMMNENMPKLMEGNCRLSTYGMLEICEVPEGSFGDQHDAKGVDEDPGRKPDQPFDLAAHTGSSRLALTCLSKRTSV